MIYDKLVPFHIARKLYDLGYTDNTEYSYPITTKGSRYKTAPTVPYLDINIKNYGTGTEYKKILTGTDFTSNRLAAPTVWETMEYLLHEYNILIDSYSYRSRGDYKNCQWVVDINKRAEVYSNGHRVLFDTRIDALQKAVEIVVNKLITDLKS